ncbi:3-ketoacyl-CoA reductase [Punctularia strigosozonata HHB-11173 SS5]|uniref:3-ketoacyl-CoA reductase n=1 Tax=Punctularia strigosozonata (strain HHB-11173) TaxID=741275 RepID=UPI000441694B|nr:3-ketoacyl-CoA reductase [Punctularia strigosozonata HHB-11173 SS5]EIN06457.1 3-ketoacyl-CoA reductase [Punctularia strigosozonata HHB-11173 SS5]
MDAVIGSVASHPVLSATLLAFGAVSFLQFVFKASQVLVQTFVLPGASLKKFGAGKGSWAVVTGPTSGIGLSFAQQLAKAGFNIVLCARNEVKLQELAKELEASHQVQTISVVLDFANPDHPGWETLKEKVSPLDVGVLVNNAGLSHPMPTYFAEVPNEDLTNIVNVNCLGTLRATRAVVGGMVQRKRGLILSIGSFSGAIPSPMLAPYSASKAFVSTFSDALQEELKGSGVIVQCVNTYFVVSNMSKIKRSSFTVPIPDSYVRSVLRHIGQSCGAAGTDRPATLTAYPSHAIADYLVHAVSNVFSNSVFISYTHSLHKSIRKRALAKAERESKKVT